MASSSLPPAMEDGEYRNWAELPPELTSSILHRLGAIQILENAQKVCRSWRRVCKDPSMWRTIDMHNLGDLGDMDYDLEIMCRHAVDRSQGGLRQIDLWYFGTDNLLNYIADRSSNLRNLKLAMCYPITDEGFVEAVVKLPSLEELEVSYCSLSGESLKVLGQSCPNMKTLKVNCVGYRRLHRFDKFYYPKKMASSSSPSPTSVPSLIKDDKWRNWADLPAKLTSSILLRLGTIEILENGQKVCRSWHRVCKDPSMWRKIDIENRDGRADFKYNLDSMCRHAVDRSQGGLLEIEMWYYGSNDLINYIADRSRNLKSLSLVRCFPITDEGVAEAVSKLPLLEDLEVTYSPFPGKSLRAIGKSCPNLKTLKINCNPEIQFYGNEFDSNAIAIAESMPGLRHLQLLGNGITNKGLKAILDGCPHLEHLDLRQCYNINLVGDLKNRCLERIKVLRRPNDSTRDCPYDRTGSFDNDSEDDGEYFY